MGKATSCFGVSPSRHPLPCSVRVSLHVFYSSAQSVCAYLVTCAPFMLAGFRLKSFHQTLWNMSENLSFHVVVLKTVITRVAPPNFSKPSVQNFGYVFLKTPAMTLCGSIKMSLVYITPWKEIKCNHRSTACRLYAPVQVCWFEWGGCCSAFVHRSCIVFLKGVRGAQLHVWCHLFSLQAIGQNEVETVFSGDTHPGTWWQSACGQPSLGPPRSGPPSKFVCRFHRFRPFFVVLCRLFRRLCCRGRCVGCVFSLFSVFVVFVAWVPFPVCCVVAYRFRCSFVFVGVSLFSLFLRCLVVPSIPPRICFSIHAMSNCTWGRPPPPLVSAHRGTSYHVRYGFCYMYFIHHRSLFVLTCATSTKV